MSEPKEKKPASSDAKEYSELALWSVLGQVELLISMAKANVPEIASPATVSLLLRIASETKTQNSILAQKALQAVIDLDDMTYEILEEGAALAKSKGGAVADSLNTKHELDLGS